MKINVPQNILDEVFAKYQINTPLRKSHFMANCHNETGGFEVFEENLNYSTESLIKLFSRKRISLDDCKKYGRSKTKPANKEMIANILYGGEWGKLNLGNTQPNDGYYFRGRGAIQITGRRNYTAYFNAIKEPLNPDKLLELKYALDSAGWFWQMAKVNALADKNDIAAVRKRVNGGSIGLEEVKELFKEYYEYYKK